MQSDFEFFGNMLIGIPSFLFGIAKKILEIPNTVMDHLSHDLMKQIAKDTKRHSDAEMEQMLV